MKLSTIILSAVAVLVAVPVAVKGVPALITEGKARAPVVHVALPLPATPSPAAVERFSDPERARWACSHALEARAYVPGSIKWIRRSQWPTLEVSPGVWSVVANYTADNRMGGNARQSSTCGLVLRDGTFVVTGVK